MMNKYKKYLLILLQFLLLAVIALIAAFINGWIGFKSVLLGGVAWIIPTVYFMWRLHRKTLYNSQEMLGYFLLSEVVKLFLSFGIIVLVLSLCTVNRISFLIGYITMILASSMFLRRGVKNGKCCTSS